jgi:hypothetical protein
MSRIVDWIIKNLALFLITVVFAGGLYYAATTSWQNSRELTDQTAQLGQIRGALADIKRSLISVLLDKDPNKSEIIKGLVSDHNTLQGVNNFKAGNFDGAYAIWSKSAQQGNTESAFAISAANSILKAQATDFSLPPATRAKAQAALSQAPRVKINNGKPIVLKKPADGG